MTCPSRPNYTGLICVVLGLIFICCMATIAAPDTVLDLIFNLVVNW